MTDTKIKVKTNEMEIIKAIDYMYGLGSIREAETTLANGEYTREEIYNAIAWYRGDGLPYKEKKEWVANTGLQEVIETYGNLI